MEGIPGLGDKSDQRHHDTCTRALCVCGLDDGTPTRADYEAAGQPLPGCGVPIDEKSIERIIAEKRVWEVVGRFCKLGWEWEIGYGDVTEAHAGFARGWYAMLMPPERDGGCCEDWPLAYGESAQLAIYRVGLMGEKWLTSLSS